MRVRRETGDFNISIVDNAAEIRANLFAEQLLGQIIEEDGDFAIVTGVAVGSGVYTLTAGDSTYTYTVATGAVAKN